MSAKQLVTSVIRGILQEVQRVCRDESDAVLITIIKAILLAREGVEQMCRVAKLFEKSTDMEAKIVEALAVRSIMHSHPEAKECQGTALKIKLPVLKRTQRVSG